MITFHRFLIGTAIIFCVVFATWSVTAYQRGEGGGALALAVAFGAAAIGLAYYLKNLKRFLGRR
jgi:hypothetical protein